MPYLFIVIPEIMMNYDKYIVNQPNYELDYEDDDENNLKNKNISIFPD